MLEAVDAKKFVLARSKPGRPCGVPHPRPPFSGRSCIEYSVKHFLCGGPLAARYKCLRSTTEQASLANKESGGCVARSEEHTSELQSRLHLVCRLLLEKKHTCNDQHQHAPEPHHAYQPQH